MRIDSHGLEQVYITGELRWKNPSSEVIREFEVLWPSQNIASLGSVGSGHEGVNRIDESKAVADAMERMSTDSEKVAEDIAYRFKGRNTYFRLSVQQGLQQNPAHRPLTLNEIEAHTRVYLRSADTKNILRRLVESLLHAIEVSPWTTTRELFEGEMDGYISEYSQFVDNISVATVQILAQEGLLLLEAIHVGILLCTDLEVDILLIGYQIR
jgi:hypothetical protein